MSLLPYNELKSWTEELESGYQWIEALMRRFQYKPGWKFELHRKPESYTVQVDIRFRGLDSYGTLQPLDYQSQIAFRCGFCGEMGTATGTIEIGGGFLVPRYIVENQGEGGFWNWLARTIQHVEQHEQDEWFKVDGLPFNDPHAASTI